MISPLDFYSLLYGRCEAERGEIIVCKQSSRLGVYRCTDWRQAITTGQAKKNIFTKINLFAGDAVSNRGPYAVGGEAEVKTITAFALDVDADKEGYASRAEAIEALNAMPVKPTAIINSRGELNGYHVYWCLETPYTLRDDSDRYLVGKLSERWQDHLRAILGGRLDSTSGIERVLRLVGSTRSDGSVVSVAELHADRLYSLADLALPPSYQTVTPEQAKEAFRKLPTGYECESDHPVSEYVKNTGLTVDSLLAQHGYQQVAQDQWRREGSESSRSFVRATKFEGVVSYTSNGLINTGGGKAKGYRLDQLFVLLNFPGSDGKGDWTAAASWCHEQAALSLPQVNFEGLTK